MIVPKAEEAARDSRVTKQDRYAEMRRRKDEEHEARERMLVGLLFFLIFVLWKILLSFLLKKFLIIYIGGRSQGSEGQRRGSCCT